MQDIFWSVQNRKIKDKEGDKFKLYCLKEVIKTRKIAASENKK